MMKLMNFDTHSWTVSFASLAIFLLARRAFFIIRLIFAIGRNLSYSWKFEFKCGLYSPLSWLPHQDSCVGHDSRNPRLTKRWLQNKINQTRNPSSTMTKKKRSRDEEIEREREWNQKSLPERKRRGFNKIPTGMISSGGFFRRERRGILFFPLPVLVKR